MIDRSCRWFVGLACLLGGWAGSVRAVDTAAQLAGEWKTTRGPLTLQAKGEGLVGRLVFWKLPVTGEIQGGNLVLHYDEGQLHYDATLKVDPKNRSFSGQAVEKGGDQGSWEGWRFDKAVATGPAADFAGLWLTDLGLMDLTRDGTKFRGKYALRGGSTIEGEVKGRRLEAKIRAMYPGPALFDLDPDGEGFFGAGGTNGMAPWYGWNGLRATNFARHAPLQAGELVDGSTANLLTYTVRAPDGYKAGDNRKWPTVVILHGANMSGRAYVNTIAQSAPEIARDYILLGINGEVPSRINPDNPAFNYTYVNFMGRSTYKGFPGTDRESPALVGEAMAELREVYPVQHYFVGGHSQGGYLAYTLLMHRPELMAGAFPMSAQVMMQNEPNVFADAPTRAAQRAVPLAIVHGRTDPIMDFASATYGYGQFLDAGWPALHLFADENAGHNFAFLPIQAAIRWLEAMSATDPARLLTLAESSAREQKVRDSIAALRRARTLPLSSPEKARLDRISQPIEAVAATKARQFLPQLAAGKPLSEIDEFLGFRDQYEWADAARPAMAAFEARRAEQNEPASKLANEGWGLFRQNKREAALGKFREIVAKYPASDSYRVAKRQLAEQP